MQAAQAVAQTKEDRWFIAQLQLRAAAAASDYAGLSAAADAVAASGVSSPKEVGSLYGEIANKLYNAKQYSQAAALYEKSAKLDPSNVDVQICRGNPICSVANPRRRSPSHSA